MADNDNKNLKEIEAAVRAKKDDVEVSKELNALSEKNLELLLEAGNLSAKNQGIAKEILLQKQKEIASLQKEREALEKILELDGHRYAKAQAKQMLAENAAASRAAEIKDLEKQLTLSKELTEAEKERIAKRLTGLKLVHGAQGALSRIPVIGGFLSKAIDDPKKASRLAGVAIWYHWASQTKKLAMDLHNTEAAFMKTTGASKDFASSISDVYGETRKYGVATKDVSDSMAALHAGFTDFTFASKAQRESLSKTGAVLGKMGVSQQDFASGVQISTKALGMSAEAANQEMLNMEKFAENIGVAPAEMAKQFAGAGNMMAKMGDQGVGAFKDLAIAAKVSGMQMEKILQLTNKFDTFEGAAEMAGKLNAAMGGNFVNAMDMMMATNPAERFEMIRDSLSSAGLEFDNMSYYQTKFYADSLGLSDVSELALIMSGNTETLAGATEKSAQSYADAAKRAQTMQSFQENLNAVFVQLIPVMTSVIDKFSVFINWVATSPKVIGAMRGVMALLLIVTAALAIKMAVLAAGVLGVTFPVWGTVLAITALVGAAALLGSMFFSDKQSPFTFLGGLMEIGGAFEFIGAAIEALPDFMKGGAALTTSMTNNTVAKVGGAPGVAATAAAGGTGTTETVRQPISIELKGKKLADFVVEVVGEKVYEINYA